MNIQKLIRIISRKLHLPERHISETSKVRDIVISYCNGYGCDIGFGGDKIKKENCVGIDYATPYTNTGKDKVDIACDVMKESIPVPDNTFDYVYSSHLIEDFVDTKKGLIEFLRVLKSGGNLVLVFPDQKAYERHCRRTGQLLNIHHVHADMGEKFMLDKLAEISGIQTRLLFSSNCKIDYNVILVLEVTKQ